MEGQNVFNGSRASHAPFKAVSLNCNGLGQFLEEDYVA